MLSIGSDLLGVSVIIQHQCLSPLYVRLGTLLLEMICKLRYTLDSTYSYLLILFIYYSFCRSFIWFGFRLIFFFAQFSQCLHILRYLIISTHVSLNCMPRGSCKIFCILKLTKANLYGRS